MGVFLEPYILMNGIVKDHLFLLDIFSCIWPLNELQKKKDTEMRK